MKPPKILFVFLYNQYRMHTLLLLLLIFSAFLIIHLHSFFLSLKNTL